MKAIGVTIFGGPEALRGFELPEPHAGAGGVRLRVHAAAITQRIRFSVPPVCRHA